jgi:hypothetical protein
MATPGNVELGPCGNESSPGAHRPQSPLIPTGTRRAQSWARRSWPTPPQGRERRLFLSAVWNGDGNGSPSRDEERDRARTGRAPTRSLRRRGQRDELDALKAEPENRNLVTLRRPTLRRPTLRRPTLRRAGIQERRTVGGERPNCHRQMCTRTGPFDTATLDQDLRRVTAPIRLCQLFRCQRISKSDPPTLHAMQRRDCACTRRRRSRRPAAFWLSR